jgi:release factor glutamine methyltransferase
MSSLSTAIDLAPAPAFRPSEYTAALVAVLQRNGELVQGARVLDVGCGSGVLLAAAGMLGAAALCGVDVEAGAVSATDGLLCGLGLADRAQIRQGHLFDPVRGRTFDLVVANLPHFPMEPRPFDTRRSSWSAGGADGRALLDPFLAGVGDHLAPGGRAFLVHNAFLGLEATVDILTQTGLRADVAETILVHVPEEKVSLMTPSILARETGRSIFRIGPYTFARVLALVISRDPNRSTEAR